MERIDPRNLLVAVAEILGRLKIPYLVSGGMAVLVWGRPRFTADIDIVVELAPECAEKLEKALQKLGEAGYVDREAIARALRTEGEFNFIDGTTGVKVDFWILKKHDSFDESRIRRRRAKTILGRRISFTSPEDLILIKLVWYKEAPLSRQLEDIESVFKISGAILDRIYLKTWAKKLGVSELLSTFLQK